MAATSASVFNPALTSNKHPKEPSHVAFISNLRMSTSCLTKFQLKHLSPSSIPSQSPRNPICPAANPTCSPSATTATTFHGLCYVLGDNIDTDQIIPAEHLTLVPSKPDEYRKLGSHALIGLPSTYETRFIETGEVQSKYSIIIGGENFGCGSSREHGPVALGAAGVKAVVAESYARIFFRNSVATGEVYPLESRGGGCVMSVLIG
ncbi:hypothetical protein IFM89_030457 [Coptis chinensis]|uniref:Aconitase A/isopropylmalate dehydratase small subunit swivel domain-containing protein n=1 Tax=Coptis chinensis TaxID=261450 RepID=A0A835HCG1_9MAGN|nr:hypothetical protein IFM89_030457 [Coptis chinensis]